MANTTNQQRVQSWREKNAQLNKEEIRHTQKSDIIGKGYQRSLEKLRQTFFNKLKRLYLVQMDLNIISQ